MGDYIVFLIPTDPTWQPTASAAQRTADEACAVAGISRRIYPNIEVEFFDRMMVAHPHENLERIGCPRCGSSIDVAWFNELLAPGRGELDDLTATVPCCHAEVSLADLDFDWPAGFSRFQITLWNPDPWDAVEEHLAALSRTLGHELRIVHAHL
jgi:hypothetical protein